MSGEYVREAAVLVLVFIPLDLWKHDEITAARIAAVAGVSAVIFLLGVACEWTSYAVKWGRTVWEKEEAE